MSWKRFGFACLAFLCTGILVVACSGNKSANSGIPLKIGYSAWPGFLPIVIAQEKGYFKDQGVTVELDYSDNTTTQIADFTAGKLDGAFLALGSIVSLTVQNPGVGMILVSDQSEGADAVVANPPIKSVAQLKGKRLGTNLGGFGELFLTRMLELNNLTRNDITLVNVIAEDVAKSMAEKIIDAGSTWEPFVSEAVKAGATVIFSSADTPGLIPDGLVVSPAVMKERPEQLQAFLRAWFQAVDDWLADPQAGSELIAKTLKITPDAASLEGIKLMTLMDNLTAFTPAETTDSLHFTAKLYSDFFVRTGGLSRPPQLETLLNDSWLKQVATP